MRAPAPRHSLHRWLVRALGRAPEAAASSRCHNGIAAPELSKNGPSHRMVVGEIVEA